MYYNRKWSINIFPQPNYPTLCTYLERKHTRSPTLLACSFVLLCRTQSLRVVDFLVCYVVSPALSQSRSFCRLPGLSFIFMIFVARPRLQRYLCSSLTSSVVVQDRPNIASTASIYQNRTHAFIVIKSHFFERLFLIMSSYLSTGTRMYRYTPYRGGVAEQRSRRCYSELCGTSAERSRFCSGGALWLTQICKLRPEELEKLAEVRPDSVAAHVGSVHWDLIVF